MLDGLPALVFGFDLSFLGSSQIKFNRLKLLDLGFVTRQKSPMEPSLPTTPQPPPLPSQPPRRNWWERNWKWFVPTGCMTLIVLAMLFVACIVFFALSILKSSDA